MQRLVDGYMHKHVNESLVYVHYKQTHSRWQSDNVIRDRSSLSDTQLQSTEGTSTQSIPGNPDSDSLMAVSRFRSDKRPSWKPASTHIGDITDRSMELPQRSNSMMSMRQSGRVSVQSRQK